MGIGDWGSGIGAAKILILEMETESHEKQDKITITPEGLLGSLRKKKYPNDNYAYFGYKEIGENVIKLLINIFKIFYRKIM